MDKTKVTPTPRAGKHRPPTQGVLRDSDGRTWRAVHGGDYWTPDGGTNEPSIPFNRLSDAHGPLIRQEGGRPSGQTP